MRTCSQFKWTWPRCTGVAGWRCFSVTGILNVSSSQMSKVFGCWEQRGLWKGQTFPLSQTWSNLFEEEPSHCLRRTPPHCTYAILSWFSVRVLHEINPVIFASHPDIKIRECTWIYVLLYTISRPWKIPVLVFSIMKHETLGLEMFERRNFHGTFFLGFHCKSYHV